MCVLLSDFQPFLSCNSLPLSLYLTQTLYTKEEKLSTLLSNKHKKFHKNLKIFICIFPIKIGKIILPQIKEVLLMGNKNKENKNNKNNKNNNGKNNEKNNSQNEQ